MCRFDQDPLLPAPWIRRLWRTIVIGATFWLLFAPEARAARLLARAGSGGADESVSAAVAASQPSGTARLHAPCAR